MAGRDQRSTTSPSSGWLAGLVLGALVGITTISFVLGFLGLPLLVSSILLILWKGPRVLAMAGFLTGWGLLWTVAITQATIACITFERGPGRDCEPGDVGPFLAVGVAVFAVGIASSAWALRRSRR